METQAKQFGILAAEKLVRRAVGKGELAADIGFDQSHRHGVEHIEHAAFQCIDLAFGLE